jgi:nucleotide-binding universal stress UspA family protein
MVFFAYDGTINGDWVSSYALRMAAHHASRRLCLVHVDERLISRQEAGQKIDRIRAECERLSIELRIEMCPAGPSVSKTLFSLIPSGPDVFVVCGARAKETGRGLLAGTVGQRFLLMGGRHVLALRVVQPGLLGVPRQLLIPIAGYTTGVRSCLPFLKLLAADITHIDLLHVERIPSTALRALTHEQSVHLRRSGVGLCTEVERELALALGPKVAIDSHVVVSDDIAKEIIVQAGKLRSRLVLMGASQRNLARRLVGAGPLERVLHNAPCDVGIYRGPA